LKNNYEIRGDVTAIFLKTKDGDLIQTLINTLDFEKVNSFSGTWHLNTNSPNRNKYAVIRVSVGYKKQKLILLHRTILGAPEGYEVDHINHHTLDNTRANLRILAKAENQQNRLKCNIQSKSGIRGVHWDKRKYRWKAELQINNKSYLVGRFKEIKDAEMAVIKARMELMPYSIEEDKECLLNL
jgi:hypothetical protein